MKRILFVILIIGLIIGNYILEASDNLIYASGDLEVYKMPTAGLSGNNTAPSIAGNLDGDVMVVFRNRYKGMMYYYKLHGTNKWVGPKEIPNEPYPVNIISHIDNSSMTTTSEGNFHLFWSIRNAAYGGYYSYFNIKTLKWSNPMRVKSGDLEWPRIISNPVNDDVVFYYVQNVGGKKDPWFFVKRPNGTWIKPVNVANFGITGRASAADAMANFDEVGNLYFVYRTKSVSYEGRKIAIALFDKNYKLDQRGEFTKGRLDGDLYLPSVAVYQGEGLVAFERNGSTYYYIPIKIKNYDSDKDNYLLFDEKDFKPIVSSPGWYEYHSRLLSHGDELIFVYKDTGTAIKMLRYKNGKWLDNPSDPISLSNMVSNFTFNTYSAPAIGILSTWFTRVEPTEVYFSIYNYLKIVEINSAVIDSIDIIIERSFFSTHYINHVKWHDDDENIKNKIDINGYNVYRRKEGDKENAEKIASVDKGVFEYYDHMNIKSSSDNNYEYYVTTIDKNGRESKIMEDGWVKVSNN